MRMMHTIAIGIAAALAALVFAASSPRAAGAGEGALARLVAAYPAALCGAEENAVVWCDGARMAFDDGRAKSFEEKLRAADLEDQMSIPYPTSWEALPARDEDPGRIRCGAFFEKMYGATKKAVEANLESVPWLPEFGGGELRATRVNGVADALRAASREMAGLDGAAVQKVRRAGGGFAWRKIAGTGRPSPHAFGIAVDIDVSHAHYWRWDRARLGEIGRRFDDIPEAAVRIFERHGFIWGGRWYHYDTMHFEYRPELAKER